MEVEEWKDVVGYEGLYTVSNTGKVMSLNYNNTGNEGILSQSKDKDGYSRVILSDSGKRKTISVHRLVAIAFIPNPNNLPQVNHIDEVRDNNNVNNLEWCTLEYNINYGDHMKKLKLNHVKGKTHPQSKKTTCDDIVFDTIKDCANYIGVNVETVKDWLSPKRNSCMPKEFYDRGLRYYGTDMSDYTYSSKALRTKRKVYCDGRIFNSIKDCAEYIGVNKTTLGNWLKGVTSSNNRGLENFDLKLL